MEEAIERLDAAPYNGAPNLFKKLADSFKRRIAYCDGGF
jgi:hypothetical protein